MITQITITSTVEVLLTTAREEMSTIKADKLVDNRDYQVNEVCDSRHTAIVALQKTCSYTHDTIYVKLRHFMINSLLVLQDIVSSKGLDTIDEMVASFTRDVVERVTELPSAQVNHTVFCMLV